jgi:hypothetical protein
LQTAANPFRPGPAPRNPRVTSDRLVGLGPTSKATDLLSATASGKKSGLKTGSVPRVGLRRRVTGRHWDGGAADMEIQVGPRLVGLGPTSKATDLLSATASGKKSGLKTGSAPERMAAAAGGGAWRGSQWTALPCPIFAGAEVDPPMPRKGPLFFISPVAPRPQGRGPPLPVSRGPARAHPYLLPRAPSRPPRRPPSTSRARCASQCA